MIPPSQGGKQAPALRADLSALTGRGGVSLSSLGGEGQGEEAVYLSHHAGRIETATRWKVPVNRGIGNGEGEGALGLSSQGFKLSVWPVRCP